MRGRSCHGDEEEVGASRDEAELTGTYVYRIKCEVEGSWEAEDASEPSGLGDRVDSGNNR